MKDFCPVWLTTEDFLNREKVAPFHKEEAKVTIASDIKNYHILTRAEVEYDGVSPVLLRATADDYYKLYINGEYVCQGPAPSYHTSYYYNELDITSYLQKGRNVIAFHLYYQGLINRVWQSGDNRFGLGVELYAGEKLQPLTFKYKRCTAYSGDILGYDTDFAENFDSRLWENNWCSLDYACSDWSDMVAVDNDYTFVKQPTRLIDAYSLKPYKIDNINNKYIIDMGTELAGTLSLRAVGSAGDRVVIHYAEELSDDGSLRYELRANCRYEEIWTLADGESVFEGYCYKGFRYVELICESSDIEITDIDIICRHYPFDDNYCKPTFENKRLGDIFELCKNTIKYGTQESFIDCPTREKGQYIGDAFIAGHSYMLLTGDTVLVEKCIEDFAKTSQICKGLMAVSGCSFMQEIADYSLIFGELVLLVYSFNNDKAFLERYYNCIKDIIVYFKRYERADGLLDCVADKWNMVDWPENLRDDYDFQLTRPAVGGGVHNVINAYYIGAVATLNKIEELLGYEKSFDFEQLKGAYVSTFLRDGLFVDSEGSVHTSLHSNAFALYFDLVPDSSKSGVVEYILGKGFACGTYVSYFVMKALAGAGKREELYELLLNDSEHSWINMIREGATTCFEVWGKEQKWNTSLFHPWSTAPISIILEDFKLI